MSVAKNIQILKDLHKQALRFYSKPENRAELQKEAAIRHPGNVEAQSQYAVQQVQQNVQNHIRSAYPEVAKAMEQGFVENIKDLRTDFIENLMNSDRGQEIREQAEREFPHSVDKQLMSCVNQSNDEFNQYLEKEFPKMAEELKRQAPAEIEKALKTPGLH